MELDNCNIVLKYVKGLKNLKKKVFFFGFFNSKIEDENYIFKYINLKNIDWVLCFIGLEVKVFM